MDKLMEILKRIKPETDFTASNDLIDEGILDSLDIVSIISEIEKAYFIEIDPDNFQSISSMFAMIEKVIK